MAQSSSGQSEYTCIDCNESSLYTGPLPLWRRQLALVCFIAGIFIMCGGMLLFWWRAVISKAHILWIRAPLALSMTTVGLVITSLAPLRDFIGEENMPCWLGRSFPYWIAATLPPAALVRVLSLFQLKLRQRRVAASLSMLPSFRVGVPLRDRPGHPHPRSTGGQVHDSELALTTDTAVTTPRFDVALSALQSSSMNGGIGSLARCNRGAQPPPQQSALCLFRRALLFLCTCGGTVTDADTRRRPKRRSIGSTGSGSSAPPALRLSGGAATASRGHTSEAVTTGDSLPEYAEADGSPICTTTSSSATGSPMGQFSPRVVDYPCTGAGVAPDVSLAGRAAGLQQMHTTVSDDTPAVLAGSAHAGSPTTTTITVQAPLQLPPLPGHQSAAAAAHPSAPLDDTPADVSAYLAQELPLQSVRGQVTLFLVAGLPVFLAWAGRMIAWGRVGKLQGSNGSCSSLDVLDIFLLAASAAFPLYLAVRVAIHLQRMPDTYYLREEIKFIAVLYITALTYWMVGKALPAWDAYVLNSDYATFFASVLYSLAAVWGPVVASYVVPSWRPTNVRVAPSDMGVIAAAGTGQVASSGARHIRGLRGRSAASVGIVSSPPRRRNSGRLAVSITKLNGGSERRGSLGTGRASRSGLYKTDSSSLFVAEAAYDMVHSSVGLGGVHDSMMRILHCAVDREEGEEEGDNDEGGGLAGEAASTGAVASLPGHGGAGALSPLGTNASTAGASAVAIALVGTAPSHYLAVTVAAHTGGTPTASSPAPVTPTPVGHKYGAVELPHLIRACIADLPDIGGILSSPPGSTLSGRQCLTLTYYLVYTQVGRDHFRNQLEHEYALENLAFLLDIQCLHQVATSAAAAAQRVALAQGQGPGAKRRSSIRRMRSQASTGGELTTTLRPATAAIADASVEVGQPPSGRRPSTRLIEGEAKPAAPEGALQEQLELHNMAAAMTHRWIQRIHRRYCSATAKMPVNISAKSALRIEKAARSRALVDPSVCAPAQQEILLLLSMGAVPRFAANAANFARFRADMEACFALQLRAVQQPHAT